MFKISVYYKGSPFYDDDKDEITFLYVPPITNQTLITKGDLIKYSPSGKPFILKNASKYIEENLLELMKHDNDLEVTIKESQILPSTVYLNDDINKTDLNQHSHDLTVTVQRPVKPSFSHEKADKINFILNTHPN